MSSKDKRNLFMKHKIISGAVVLVLFILILSGCESDTASTTNSGGTETASTTTTDSKPVTYDELQQLYLDINETMSYEDVLNMVQESGLPYTDIEYNGSRVIQIAYTEGSAKQKYADSGDYLSIHFEEVRSENSNEYVFSTLEYYNNNKFITVFQYETGTYWSLRESKDRGYFINDNTTTDGYEITYSNGNTTKTDYIKVKDKDEQLNYILNFK